MSRGALSVSGTGVRSLLPGDTCAMIKCPMCKRPVRWEGNAYRPFCSARCQTRDLGNWATNRYTVPVENSPEIDEAEESPAEE
jgi:hypothetical protein